MFFSTNVSTCAREDALWAAYRLIPLEQDHATTLIAGREVVTRLVELDRGDDVRCVRVSVWSLMPRRRRGNRSGWPPTFCYVLDISLVAKAPVYVSAAATAAQARECINITLPLRRTYCVNFHVVGLPSASAMIPELRVCGVEGSDQMQLRSFAILVEQL
jgi:hypothetical protein